VSANLRGLALLSVAACAAGIVAAEFVARSTFLRNEIGRALGRGPLVARVDGVGIYQVDLERAAAESRDRRDLADAPGKADSVGDIHAIALELVANVRAMRLARGQSIPPEATGRQLALLKFQLQPQNWATALRANGLCERTLRAEVLRNLRARSWLEGKLVADVSPEECRAYYQKHPGDYVLPPRFRARHIFLAAPPDTPEEIVEGKKAAIQVIAERLAGGERFDDLAAECSEDEATKKRGGDLNFFSEFRMPADFMAAIAQMRVGQISGIVRTRLGFHVIELEELKPARQMTFDEARPEISLLLANQKRFVTLEGLRDELSRAAEFIPPLP
jgi:parvulin-like peptidyl-prolyl isomerase